MNWIRFDKNRKLNNKGNAIVSVLVVVTFITVIATTLLYVSTLNYRMRQVDYSNKKSFYSGETALEEVRGNLMKDFTVACQYAYGEVIGEYTIKNSVEKDELFRQKTTAALKSILNNHKDPTGAGIGNWDTLMDSYVDSAHAGAVHIYIPEGDDGSYTPLDESRSVVDGLIYLRGIEMEYEQDGYLTVIHTDILFVIPSLDWSVESSASTLEGGITAEEAVKRDYIKASDNVVYANWSKE